MIKHIGKHGDRKAAIVFREIPGEDHMCLIVYPDTLPVAMHDSLMKTIESDVGQTAENLGDALFRSLFPDGRPMLQTFHSEGMLKKVQTRQVVVTPNSSSHVNLEEMNKILREMKMGNDAIKRMAELDSNRGMTGKVNPRDDYGREIGAPTDRIRGANVAGSDASRALDDTSLALDLKKQAEKMAVEARGLIAESERLMMEAQRLAGVPTNTVSTKKPASKARTKKQVVADASK